MGCALGAPGSTTGRGSLDGVADGVRRGLPRQQQALQGERLEELVDDPGGDLGLGDEPAAGAGPWGARTLEQRPAFC